VINFDRLLRIGLFCRNANRSTIRHLCIQELPMPSRLEIIPQHTASELRRLARYEKDRRAAMRMLALGETIDGADRETAARRGDMSDQALRDAIKRYNAEGIEGLHDRPRTGRPAKLSEAQRSELRAIVVKGPDVEAEDLSAHTRDDLVKIVATKWSVAYDPTSVGRILRGLGLSRQKARPSHPKKDAAAAEAFKKGSGRPAENNQ
jgi:transposase